MPEKVFVFFSAGHHENGRLLNLEMPDYDPEKLQAFQNSNKTTARDLARFLFSNLTLDTTRDLVQGLVEAARLESGDVFNPQR